MSRPSRVVPSYSERKPATGAPKAKPSPKPSQTQRTTKSTQSTKATKASRRRKTVATSPQSTSETEASLPGGAWTVFRLSLPFLALLPLALLVDDERLAVVSGFMLAWCGGVAAYAVARRRRGGLVYGLFALVYAALTALLLVF